MCTQSQIIRAHVAREIAMEQYMVDHNPEIEALFNQICADESWRRNLADVLANECLNFAHRVIAYIAHQHREDALETRARALSNTARAILAGLRAFDAEMQSPPTD